MTWAWLALLGAALASPTLDDVLASVDRHHPVLLAALAEQDAAAGARLGALGWLDPRLEVDGTWRTGTYDAGWMQTTVRQATPLYGLDVEAGYRIGVGDFPSYDGALDTLDRGALFAALRLPLLKDGLTDDARTGVALARLELDAARAQVEARRVELGREARHAWWKWVAAGEKRRIALAAAAVAEASEAAVRRQVELGDAAAIDVVDATRVRVERAVKVVEQDRDVRAAAFKLGLYLRDGVGAPAPPVDEASPALPRPDAHDLPDPEEAVTVALRGRPEVAVLAAKRDATAAKTRLARVALLPKLDVKLGLEQDLAAVGEGAEPLDVKVGGVFELPLLLRPGRGKLEVATGEQASADAKLRWLEDKVAAEVRTAWAVAEAAHRLALLADETARLAREVEVATRRRWELGDVDLFRLYLREQSTLKSELDAAEAWGEYHAARASLEAAMGRR